MANLNAFFAARSAPPPPPPPDEDWIREMTRDTSRYAGSYSTILSPPSPTPPITVDIDENMNTIGTRVWDCSVLMAHQFLHHSSLLSTPSPPPNLVDLSGRLIVEIGSGCGLLPIAISKFPAHAPSKIVATEYLPSIIDHLQRQVAKVRGGDGWSEVTAKSLHRLRS